jgi:DNA-binding protein YbaB
MLIFTTPPQWRQEMFKGGMAGMMKKAQQMQDNVQQAQAEIKQLTATGTAGGRDCVLIGDKQSVVRFFANTR